MSLHDIVGFLDGRPHHQPAGQRDRVERDVETVAIAVQPCGADSEPVGILAVTGDDVETKVGFLAF